LLALAPTAASAAEDRPAVVPGSAASHQHRHGGEGANRDWTGYPLITPVMGGADPRTGATLAIKNIQSSMLEVFSPASESGKSRWQVQVGPRGAKVEAPKIGNYHWISAREEREGHVAVASTVYFFGNPGPAPTKLLLSKKNELEIIPQPLPREHANYRENEKWRFLVRFNGQPLSGKTVVLETENGNKSSFASDAQGAVTVLFPRDMKAPAADRAEGHNHGPRRAKFVLAAEHVADGTHYVTAFNYVYTPDAYAGKSLWAGLGFGVFGMLLATPMLRRKKLEKVPAGGQ
jgi:hypothetical protein